MKVTTTSIFSSRGFRTSLTPSPRPLSQGLGVAPKKFQGNASVLSSCLSCSLLTGCLPFVSSLGLVNSENLWKAETFSWLCTHLSFLASLKIQRPSLSQHNLPWQRQRQATSQLWTPPESRLFPHDIPQVPFLVLELVSMWRASLTLATLRVNWLQSDLG